MKRLNRKGYITVEILIASIISAVIAVFLIQLTVKLVSKTDDVYIDTVLTTDKALIIKNIRRYVENDIKNKGIVKKIECTTDDKCNITFNNDDVRIIYIEDKKIKYCSDIDNDCIYEKELDSSLSNIVISNNDDDDNYAFFIIRAENIFTREDYTINIPILNKYVDNTTATNTYTVTIIKTLGTSTTTVETQSVQESKSTAVTVTIPEKNYNYSSVSCDNDISATYISKTTFKGITSYKFSIGPVSSNTTCNIIFNEINIGGGSGSATS